MNERECGNSLLQVQSKLVVWRVFLLRLTRGGDRPGVPLMWPTTRGVSTAARVSSACGAACPPLAHRAVSTVHLGVMLEPLVPVP